VSLGDYDLASFDRWNILPKLEKDPVILIGGVPTAPSYQPGNSQVGGITSGISVHAIEALREYRQWEGPPDRGCGDWFN